MLHTLRHFITILFLLSAFSCAIRHDTRNSTQIYQEAVKKYNKKKYYDAKLLFQEASRLLKKKAAVITTHLYIAKCLFYDKDYRKSAQCFAEFCKNYPKTAHTEEAHYMQGYALYLDTPSIQLDNTFTEEALTVLKQYRDQYPTGVYQAEVKQYIRELQAKLAEKAFRNATQYYKLGHYRAAIISINNFQTTYLDNIHDEEAHYLKFAAQAELTAEAIVEDQQESWNKALFYYAELVEQYPISKYIPMANKLREQTLSKINTKGR